jgi:hypothetical protein
VCPAGTMCIAGACGQLVNGLGGTGFGDNRLYLNDDGSTCASSLGPGPIDLGIVAPSGLSFYGTTYRQLCLNNNGNVNLTTSGAGISVTRRIRSRSRCSRSSRRGGATSIRVPAP